MVFLRWSMIEGRGDFLFKKNKQHKIFQRILITSSLTIIVAVIFPIVLMSNYYSDSIIQREIDLNNRTLERIEDYFIHKENGWNGFIRDLYIREDLMEDVTNILHHEYDKYIELRMENYANQSSFTPNDTFTYFNSFFSQDEDVNAAILQSSQYADIRYEFIYDYGSWNESLDGTHIYDLNEVIDSSELNDTFAKTLSINNPATLEKMGDLTIYYSTQSIENMLASEDHIESAYYLVNQQENIVFEESEGITKEDLDPLLASIQEEQKRENNEYLIQSFEHINGMTSYMVIPKKELNTITFVRGTMWLLIILTLVTALVLTYFVIRKYSARIDRIDQTMKEVQAGNLTVRIPMTKHKDELTTISKSFNHMLDDLNEYIDQVYVLDLKQQEAELKVLQSQINPHFLFNTLETIRMSAVIEGSKKSGKMIYHLSRLLRYSLNKNDFVPLKEEFENARQYLELIQQQHPEKLMFDLRILPEVEQIYVPKLILQPIIENYIIHGFRKESYFNYLNIRTELDDNHLFIIVEDNGTGMSDERLTEIRCHLNDAASHIRSLGMKNVHQRLKLNYGEAYGLSVDSIESIGTKVVLKIPRGGASFV